MLTVVLVLAAHIALRAGPNFTLDDLAKLDITCFVPGYLPRGFQLTDVEITQEENPSAEPKRTFSVYQLEYEGPHGATFSVESAYEGIGDRNIMETEDSEERELHSPIFGPVYIIYTPKGKSGVKKEIIANWVEDANMKAELAAKADAHAVLGRFHGFTGTHMTVAEFARIIDSLHPARSAAASPSPSPAASIAPAK